MSATAVATSGLRSDTVRDPSIGRRRIKIASVFTVMAAFLLWFALSMRASYVQFLLAKYPGPGVPVHTLATRPTAWVSLAVVVVIGGLAVADLLARRSVKVLAMSIAGLAFAISFLVWAYAAPNAGFLADPLPGTVSFATPLILGAMSGCLCERSAVINVAIEGQFLVAAFLASVFASMTQVGSLGLLGGVIAGIAMAALLALFAIKYHVNQVVLGVVLILLATGLTGFFLDQIPNVGSVTDFLNNPPVLLPIAIPGLASIPFLGDSFFNQTILVYIMYASVAFVTFLIFRTRWGLRVRAVGEHPTAADTVGIKVNRMRWQAVLLGGVFAGLGGAFFTVGSAGAFNRGDTGGNGFIALAALIMGRWHPIGATFAALFFGFMESLALQLGTTGRVPSDLLAMAPYVATIVVVAGFVGRVRPPAADGEPYVKG
ncbi:MAG TPA: ABC transporter permease [Nocardioidaceae bacterium]|nr:ABC transporter permease [Nocardioidaceae bacterium]